MTITENTMLYVVDFGKPDSGNGWVCSPSQTMYVLADSYAQACQKAQAAYEETIEKQSVVDSDGSLRMNLVNTDNNEVFGIKSVKLVCAKLIF